MSSSAPPTAESLFKVLVVDDEEALLRVHARALSKAGYAVTTAIDGPHAIEALRGQAFDLVLSDIDMPGMTGVQLLERVRAHDLDVPVVMITGRPSIETAAKAMEHGAFRYLTKPVPLDDLLEVTAKATRLHRLALAKREVIKLAGGESRLVGDRAGLVASFERALSSLHIAYQPIVSWSGRSIYAYEALLRSREPALPHPGALLAAAERLGRVHDLSRTIFERAVVPIDRLDKNTNLFINLHPSDLLDELLIEGGGPLDAHAERIVLEITERATLDDIGDLRDRIAALRRRGFRIAIDDLGAGYAGLSAFAFLEPDIVKLDMSLVRDLDREPTKQTLVRTMVTMCRELGKIVTTEGIEALAERDAVLASGCDLMQGYFFAKPGPAFPTPAF